MNIMVNPYVAKSEVHISSLITIAKCVELIDN